MVRGIKLVRTLLVFVLSSAASSVDNDSIRAAVFIQFMQFKRRIDSMILNAFRLRQFCCCCFDRFYIALFSALEQTHCALLVCDSK